MTSTLKSTRDINKPTGDTPQAQRQKVQSNGSDVPDVAPWPGTTAHNGQTTSEGSLQGGGATGPGGEPTNGDIFRLLLEERQNRKTDNDKILGSIDSLREKTNDLEKVVELEKTTREKEIGELKSKMENFEKRLESQPPPGIDNTKTSIKKLEIVVSGLFKERTDCEKVKQDVDRLLTNILGANHRLAITTTDTETQFALLKFPSFDEKIKFYKKMNECKKDGKLPEGVSFRDNLDFADRVTNKHLGYAKHFLMEHYNKASSQVQIHWKKQIVEMDGKKVVSFENGVWKYSKSVHVVKDKIEEAIISWVQKRETPEPPSESE